MFENPYFYNFSYIYNDIQPCIKAYIMKYLPFKLYHKHLKRNSNKSSAKRKPNYKTKRPVKKTISEQNFSKISLL